MSSKMLGTTLRLHPGLGNGEGFWRTLLENSEKLDKSAAVEPMTQVKVVGVEANTDPNGNHSTVDLIIADSPSKAYRDPITTQLLGEMFAVVDFIKYYEGAKHIAFLLAEANAQQWDVPHLRIQLARVTPANVDNIPTQQSLAPNLDLLPETIALGPITVQNLRPKQL